MTFRIVILLYLINLVFGNHINIPKVYENVDETITTDSAENIRQTRHPDKTRNSIRYSPPVFNYQAAAQQDQQRWRYHQQQLSDAQNFARNPRLLRKERVVTGNPEEDQVYENSNPQIAYTWKFDDKNKSKQENSNKLQQERQPQIWNVPDPKFGQQNRRAMNIVVPLEEVHLTTSGTKKAEDGNLNSLWLNLAHLDRMKKALRPNAYQVNEGDLETDATEDHDRRDNIALSNNFLRNPHAIYVNPETNRHVLKGQMAGFALVQKEERDVEALNALIGRNPEDQLEGLKQLLQKPAQTKIIIPVIGGAQPFHVPQITAQMNENALAKIQAKLDEAAKVEAQKVLAQAQEQAVAHVQAQHAAIALAQAQAQQAALSQMQNYQQNPHRQHRQQSVNVIAQQSQHVPQALNLFQPAVPALAHQQALAYAQAHQLQIQPPVPAVAHQQALTYAQAHQLKIQPAVPALAHQQALAYAQAHQVQVQKHQPVQTHSVVVHPTPQHLQKSQEVLHKVIHPQNHLEETDQAYGAEYGNLQYAAQYAFGYRIRDAHNGNDFGHEEKREGETAKGHYHVLLPDGRTQNVEYWADDSGYHAKVTYSNFAGYPNH